MRVFVSQCHILIDLIFLLLYILFFNLIYFKINSKIKNIYYKRNIVHKNKSNVEDPMSILIWIKRVMYESEDSIRIDTHDVNPKETYI